VKKFHLILIFLAQTLRVNFRLVVALAPSGKTILLVEDTAPLALMHEEYMHGENHHVVTVQKGQKVFAALNQLVPDAIVFDLLSPDMNGLIYSS
jgi:CheY-like chemotaxis protein